MNIKKAKYRGIPAYFDLDTNEIQGRTFLYDILISVNIWIDVHIVGVEEFPIEIKVDDDE